MSEVEFTLSFRDRVLVQKFIPVEGNIMTMLLAKDLKDKVSLTQIQLEDVDWVESPSGITWNQEKAKKYDLKIAFSKAEARMLKDEVTKQSNENKINLENVDLASRLQDLCAE